MSVGISAKIMEGSRRERLRDEEWVMECWSVDVGRWSAIRHDSGSKA